MLLIDSLSMCRFYRDFLTWENVASVASQLNEGPVTRETLKKLANDTMTRIRVLNFAMGAVPADDTVAERFFREATDKAPALDRDEFERRIRLYWRLRGWNEDGTVARD
jgi:aldehyde:ferredoxin oxidoreductase